MLACLDCRPMSRLIHLFYLCHQNWPCLSSRNSSYERWPLFDFVFCFIVNSYQYLGIQFPANSIDGCFFFFLSDSASIYRIVNYLVVLNKLNVFFYGFCMQFQGDIQKAADKRKQNIRREASLMWITDRKTPDECRCHCQFWLHFWIQKKNTEWNRSCIQIMKSFSMVLRAFGQYLHKWCPSPLFSSSKKKNKNKCAQFGSFDAWWKMLLFLVSKSFNVSMFSFLWKPYYSTHYNFLYNGQLDWRVQFVEWFLLRKTTISWNFWRFFQCHNQYRHIRVFSRNWILIFDMPQ